MADYRGLGSRTITAEQDITGLNDGNWTNAFTSDVLPQVAQWEIYRAVIKNAPAGASALITIGVIPVSFTAPGAGGGSEWDPNQAPIVLKGQEVYFLWTAAAAGTPPEVTIWRRYDASLPENMS